MKLVQKNHPILRKKAKEVPVKDINSARIKQIIKTMAEALAKEPDGIAIAAPQIGQSLQIFLVGKDKLNKKQNSASQEQKKEFLVFINPKILKTSRKHNILEEGCLSVRGIYGNVKRAEKLTIRAYDEKGKKFTRGASGLLSEIIQHEVDHLNGILFTDKAADIWKVKNQ